MPLVVLMPGLGALCAGSDVTASTIARDITGHTIEVKAKIAAMGSYRGLSESHLFEMEYRAFQQAKLDRAEPLLRPDHTADPGRVRQGSTARGVPRDDTNDTYG